MNDNDNTPDTDHDVDGSSNYTPPSYDIAPEDQHIADAIVSQDPLALPGANEAIGDPKLLMPTSLESLPPHLREAARAKMGNRVSEADAVLAVLRENSENVRAKSGFAASVDPYWHEKAAVIRDHNEMLAEFDRLAAEISNSIRYEKDENGEPKPVIGKSAERQRAITIRQRELLYRAGLLMTPDGRLGVEGQRRTAEALHASVELRKAKALDIAVHKAAAEKGEKMAFDERVDTLAEAYAKRKRRTN